MEIKVAKSAGFCFGVTRAVEKVYEQIDKGKKIYTYGSIIHNEVVVNELIEKGVTVIGSKEELRKIKTGTIIIRSHGVSKDIYEIIEEQGLECIDATCPFVKRIHKIVDRESNDGNQIIVFGNPGHPEVNGIVGWSNTPAIVLETEDEVERFEIGRAHV